MEKKELTREALGAVAGGDVPGANVIGYQFAGCAAHEAVGIGNPANGAGIACVAADTGLFGGVGGFNDLVIGDVAGDLKAGKPLR